MSAMNIDASATPSSERIPNVAKNSRPSSNINGSYSNSGNEIFFRLYWRLINETFHVSPQEKI